MDYSIAAQEQLKDYVRQTVGIDLSCKEIDSMHWIFAPLYPLCNFSTSHYYLCLALFKSLTQKQMARLAQSAAPIVAIETNNKYPALIEGHDRVGLKLAQGLNTIAAVVGTRP